MRRLVSTLLALCLISCLSPLLACHGEPPRPELVLLVTIDTLRADHLGSYGHERAQTPHLDRLAAEGLRFEHVATTSNNTLPAHAAILSGRYPQTLGVPRNSFRVPRGTVTLAEHFREAGFATAAFISASVLSSKMGLAEGFDRYDESLGVREIDQLQRRAEQTTDAVLAWLDENGDSPAFVWLHYFDPHYPYTPPAPYDTLYGDDYEGAADGSLEYLMALWGKRGDRLVADERDLQRLVDLYDGEIAYTDAQLGRVFEWVAARGLAGRAVIAVTADHGESLTEHGYLFDHGRYLYQPGLHVPMILRVPGVAPRVVAAQVQTLDLFPTLLEAAGIAIPEATEGHSLMPLLRGEVDSVRSFSFAESSRPWAVENRFPAQYRNLHKAQAVVEGPWKLIATPYKQKLELYHLQDDPGELRNRVADDTQITSRLYHVLKQWRKEDLPAGGPPDPENLEQLKALGYVE